MEHVPIFFLVLGEGQDGEDGESRVWFSCKGEWLNGEGGFSIKVSEASFSDEGHSSNKPKQLKTKALVQWFPMLYALIPLKSANGPTSQVRT